MKTKKEEDPNSFKAKFKAFHKRYKSDPRFNSFVKLGFYMVFFLILLIIVNIVTRRPDFNKPRDYEQPKEEVQSISYREILDDYSNSNKTISIKVTGNQDYFIDEILEDNIITGTLETNNNIIKYVIKENKIYELKMGNETLNETLLDNYAILFIKPSELVNKLNVFSSTKSVTEESIIYSYKEIVIDDILYTTLTITIKDNKITNIDAQSENNKYEISIK